MATEFEKKIIEACLNNPRTAEALRRWFADDSTNFDLIVELEEVKGREYDYAVRERIEQTPDETDEHELGGIGA